MPPPSLGQLYAQRKLAADAAQAIRERARVILPTGSGRYLMEEMLYPPNAGKHRFPGGKVEDGEDPIDTVVRELREETGQELSRDKLRYLGVDPDSGEHFIYAAEHRVKPGRFEDAANPGKFIPLRSRRPGGKNYVGVSRHTLAQLLQKTASDVFNAPLIHRGDPEFTRDRMVHRPAHATYTASGDAPPLFRREQLANPDGTPHRRAGRQLPQSDFWQPYTRNTPIMGGMRSPVGPADTGFTYPHTVDGQYRAPVYLGQNVQRDTVLAHERAHHYDPALRREAAAFSSDGRQLLPGARREGHVYEDEIPAMVTGRAFQNARYPQTSQEQAQEDRAAGQPVVYPWAESHIEQHGPQFSAGRGYGQAEDRAVQQWIQDLRANTADPETGVRTGDTELGRRYAAWLQQSHTDQQLAARSDREDTSWLQRLSDDQLQQLRQTSTSDNLDWRMGVERDRRFLERSGRSEIPPRRGGWFPVRDSRR